MNILYASRIIAWCLGATIIILSLVPPDLRPVTRAPHSLEHFVMYSVTGLMFGLGYTQKNVLLAFLLTLYVGVVELAQLWVPGRHARLSDFIIDAIAVNVGVLMVSLTRRMTV